jgi:glycosyltransferase involved in cell wall biosynthesis
VNAGDVQGLANAIISLVENPQLLASKSNAARDLVQQRNMPEVVFPSYERIYEQCAR